MDDVPLRNFRGPKLKGKQKEKFQMLYWGRLKRPHSFRLNQRGWIFRHDKLRTDLKNIKIKGQLPLQQLKPLNGYGQIQLPST